MLILAASDLAFYDRHNSGPGCPKVGEPVNVTNGNMYLRHDDYFLPGNGIPINLSRSYNSNVQEIGYFGLGWSSDIDERLTISCTGPFQCNTEYLLHYAPDGRINHFRETEPWIYKAMNGGNHARVQRYSDWSRDLIFKDGSIHRFDSYGNLIWKKDRNGNQTTTTYSSNGLQITITDPHGRSLTVIREPVYGMVTQVNDATGNIANYVYDTANPNLLKTITYSDGSQYKFEYDSTIAPGRILLKTVKDAVDNTVEHHLYDTQGRATTSEIHGGAEKYEFDFSNWAGSNPYTLVKHKKNTADPYIETKYFFEKDRYRNMVTKTDGACGCGGGGSEVTQYFYDDLANLTKTIDALGNETTFTYDINGNRLTQTDIFGTQQFTYNSFGQVLTYRDRVDSQNQNVKTAVMAYDSAGNLTSYTDALGKVTTIQYPATNNKGLPDWIKDARNNTTKFKWFTTSGLVEEVEDPYTKKTKFTYDGRGRVKTITNALSHVTTYNYFDDTQRKVEMIYPNLDKITYKYDSRRTLESITDERGKITTYEFDPQYRLKKITDPLGHVKEFGYDLMSNRSSYTDPLGKITGYKYDDFNRLNEIEYPAATSGGTRLKERFEYDKLGRTKKYFDTASRVTEYAYDDTARTSTVTNAELETTQIRYNQRFQTVEVKDALNQVYTFSHDPLGRMLSQTRAGGTMSFVYDAVGNVEKRIDYMGRETKYTYDILNRLTEIEYLPTSEAGVTPKPPSMPNQKSTYGYDEISRLTSATNEMGTVTFGYDNRNRIKNTTDVFGHLLEYEYELTSMVNQRRLKFDGAMYAIYNFDDAGNLDNITNSSDNTTISFDYDAEDKVTLRTYPNGVTTSYQYFDNDLLKRITDTNSSANVFDRQYFYNSARQISQIIEPTRSRTLAMTMPTVLRR